MAYSPTDPLQARIEALRTPTGSRSYASGLAEGLRRFQANRLDKQLEQRQQQNEELKQQEMQMLLNALGGAQAPMKPGMTPNFQHPEVQQLALANALQTSQAKNKAQIESQYGSDQGFGNPIWQEVLEGENRSYRPYQLTESGGLRPIGSGMDGLLPPASYLGYDPTRIQERGTAETDVAVDRQAQVGAAETETLLDRQQRMYDQEQLQELEENRQKAWSRTTAKEAQTELLTGLIGKARNQASAWTTGFLGTATEKIPGTPAFDLVSTLDTIRANIGFDKLQEMRDNSPTGGALGQVSEQENRLLQSVWGSLENSQSREQFLENLQLVEDQVARSWERVNQAYMEDYGVPYFEANPNGSGPNDEVFRQADAILNGI